MSIERADLTAGRRKSRMFWMMALAADERVTDVRFTKDTLSVAMRDGRTIAVPLAWYPRLFNATTAQRKNWLLTGGGYGIHWPDVDEDLCTDGLLRGAHAPRAKSPAARSMSADVPVARRRRAKRSVGSATLHVSVKALCHSNFTSFRRIASRMFASAWQSACGRFRCPLRLE